MSRVRTRYAPNPTRRVHVGNLRTALYACLIAKHEGGDFLLRVEDTDQERYMEGTVEIIYRTLEKTGLIHDEGPNKDDDMGPYMQSERQAAGIYLDYTKKLVEEDKIYYCSCDQERLNSLKIMVDGQEIVTYDKHCLHLTREEMEASLVTGKPYVIHQNNPTGGTTTFRDEIYRDITMDNSELDDMMLIKSDGYPAYNPANVVDDHLMGITHVVRGNEYLSSSPKYNRLCAAFGWEVPVYMHCPLITNEERKKLSKRSGHSSYEDLIEQGFLSEAMVNYVTLPGWSPEKNRGIFSLQELVEQFGYRRMSKFPAVFNVTKLKRMDGEYMESMDFDAFYEMAEPYLKETIKKGLDSKKIANMVETRIEVFPDIAEHIDFFRGLPEYDEATYIRRKMGASEETSLAVLKDVLPLLEAQEGFGDDALYALLAKYVEEKGCKTGYMMWPIRTAVLGKQMTPTGTTETMEALGKEESLDRIRKGIALLEA